ncbi:MAG: RNA-directed DNA polymerase [Candidatus Thermoplasmatota archaeon]|nr:RNA-directed DNA polymerase [Candidatus Thermoplasmatota archaeon]
MKLNKHDVLSALLQHNYFPMQKKDRDEIPPVFTSTSFTPKVAKLLIDTALKRKSEGYDSVCVKLTRFNGVSRDCSIPHPLAYAQLAFCISHNWVKMDYITRCSNSQVKIKKYKDGRLVVMDYDSSSFQRDSKNIKSILGKRFMVRTDIANFYPSIYSHALPWALVGFSFAKNHKPPKYKLEWYNQIDEKVRFLKRNETQGIAIGPATSNILSELILTRIDEKLSKSGFIFCRYVDDYTAYCNTEEEGREFIRELSEELSIYKLNLNINKTKFFTLPQPGLDHWIILLRQGLPHKNKLSIFEAETYLDLAIELSYDYPDGSVLKYALKSLVGQNMYVNTRYFLIGKTLNLAFHQPILLPILSKLFENIPSLHVKRFAVELNKIAHINAINRHSDGMAWALYYLNKYKIGIKPDVAKAIIKSHDCIALIMLYLSKNPTFQKSVMDFAKGLKSSELYDLDQHWLLLFQLFIDKKIANPYSDNVFEILKEKNVNFIEEG